jgi:hypothetical protein
MEKLTMQIHYPNSNRIGRFRVLYETLRDDGPMCGALFALCVVLDVQECETGRGKVYTAASPLFEGLKEDEEIPEYRIECSYDRPFENPEWEAKRVDSGKFRFAAFRKIVVRVPPAQMGARPNQTSLH